MCQNIRYVHATSPNNESMGIEDASIAHPLLHEGYPLLKMYK